VFTIGLNRAVTLIAEKIANPGKGRRFGADPGRALGDHPHARRPILVKKGRYGPYVTNSGINATIPTTRSRRDHARRGGRLIEARAEKTGAKPAPRRKGRARRRRVRESRPSAQSRQSGQAEEESARQVRASPSVAAE
jgi:DNA topoisomerase-1